MFGFGQLIDILKKNPRKIVFTEGSDPRILEASSRLLASTFLAPVLVGNKEEITKAAEESGFNIRGAEIIDPLDYDEIDKMVDMLCEIRKNKGMTPEQARGILSQANYFGTMLVKMGKADALLGGADIFYGRYGSSGIADHQDKAKQFHRIFLLYSGSSIRNR